MESSEAQIVVPVLLTLLILWGTRLVPAVAFPLWVCIFFTVAGAMFIVQELSDARRGGGG